MNGEIPQERRPEGGPEPGPRGPRVLAEGKGEKGEGEEPQGLPHPLVVASSPHVAAPESVEGVMYRVVLALLPAMAASVYFFGLEALKVLLIASASCLALEALLSRVMGRKASWLDGSALVTGTLLALNLPASSPWWMILVGSLLAIGVGKWVFGGLGYNPFNPALVARVGLLISFPTAMTNWPQPLQGLMAGLTTDAVTQATPLGVLKTEGVAKAVTTPLFSLFAGEMGGSLGEVSFLALLIGGVYLLIKRIITWEIPVSFMGTVFVLTAIPYLVDPTQYASPVFHLLSGGLMLGAVFMATDWVTSPLTRKGMLLFGVGCGALTAVIRLLGVYPEGVAFSILIMNGLVPLIDRHLAPKPFGWRAEDAKSQA